MERVTDIHSTRIKYPAYNIEAINYKGESGTYCGVFFTIKEAISFIKEENWLDPCKLNWVKYRIIETGFISNELIAEIEFD